MNNELHQDRFIYIYFDLYIQLVAMESTGVSMDTSNQQTFLWMLRHYATNWKVAGSSPG
jgi:hypothetical protein